MPTLDFKGKPFVYSHHLSVPFRELKIDAGKSLPGDGGPSLDDNLIIHGDNLHALKALLPKYAGKVDVIYIDPPYNTGNEGWAYNDNVNSPLLKEWLGKVVDGEDLERHDKWLCMMWPRLTLLKELLADAGVIFVSIDDNELFRLKIVLDEIFEPENYIGLVSRGTGTRMGTGSKGIARELDYVLCCSRNGVSLNRLDMTDKELSLYNLEDGKGRYLLRTLRRTGGENRREDRPTMFYAVQAPDGTDVFPLAPQGWESRWSCGEETYRNLVEQDEIVWKQTKDGWKVYQKFYAGESKKEVSDLWADIEGNKKATRQTNQIFGDAKLFDHPKPTELVKRAINLGCGQDGLILDSFAGSGTTAHAVQALNAEDGGNRKFILVETEDYADTITAERVRRVMQGVPKAKDEALKNGLGGSFTYCDLGDPIDMESFFGDSDSMPAYDQLASYIAYTATGEAMDKAPKKPAKDWFIGEVGGVRLHLIYKPDSEFMKGHDAALDMETVKTIAAGNKTGKPSYVFAAAKYMGQTELTHDYDITFCQLPYAIHRIMGDGIDG